MFLSPNALAKFARRPCRAASVLLCAAASLVVCGCQNGAFQPPPGAATSSLLAPQVPGQPQAQAAAVQDLNRRVAQLDLNNTDLHRQLAQKAQQEKALQDQVGLLQKQLGDVAQRFKDSQLAQQSAQDKVSALEASTRFRGGASITANSSVKQSLSAVSIPGLDIRQEGEVIRIEVPADKLFVPGSAQLQQNGQRIIDEIASAITRSYPRQRIVIEGHADDSSAASPTAAHQLTGQQAQAVFTQLVDRGRLPARQLSVLAMGENHPLASNATAAGKAKNRRVEIVVYPDSL